MTRKPRHLANDENTRHIAAVKLGEKLQALINGRIEVQVFPNELQGNRHGALRQPNSLTTFRRQQDRVDQTMRVQGALARYGGIPVLIQGIQEILNERPMVVAWEIHGVGAGSRGLVAAAEMLIGAV